MKLSISNIAWSAENDAKVYAMMKKYGFSGLEIAPTRIFPNAPYDDLKRAEKWQRKLYEQEGFDIPSMQSIWFGKQEKIFGSREERETLIDYTKQAIDFAASIKSRNLVFGCPKNRNVPEGKAAEIGEIAVNFFHELGEYALERGTAIGMEANPAIYNTNYINDTKSALDLIREVNSKGFLLNLDVGTMIQNQENVDELIEQVKFINHVHISEPGLKMIEIRTLHKEIKEILAAGGYKGYVSIEMGRTDNLENLENVMGYTQEIFTNIHCV